MKNKRQRQPTDNQVQAAQYNYRTSTGEKETRTREEAKGYIEGYTDGLNELDKGEKTRTTEETAQMMEKRYDQDKGGEDRNRYKKQNP